MSNFSLTDPFPDTDLLMWLDFFPEFQMPSVFMFHISTVWKEKEENSHVCQFSNKSCFTIASLINLGLMTSLFNVVLHESFKLSGSLMWSV